jgi:hypothetical protein
MNFYDVYTTLTLVPDAAKALGSICTFLGCENELETVKKALWTKPARTAHSGAFPFDEETGRIYDSLWKAAAAENYSRAERFGRWLFRTICPPADDEGPESLTRKAKVTIPDEDIPPPIESKPLPPRVAESEPFIDQEGPEWHISDGETEEHVLQVPNANKAAVTHRSRKKAD